MTDTSTITAILGPTNTGKTFYAIDRMLSHKSGIIGLPLRLLAREVFDKVVSIRGIKAVALVTGEERIIPSKPKYWVCTVEAMPKDIKVDFVAVDEIQLCADRERGHIFTDRLLSFRGTTETLFMGSDIMNNIIKVLEPRTKFIKRERFSELSYTGSKKISRLESRTAIVGFSADKVYSVAELIRRYKGGCAVVLGALSPRTRNSQVELYQNGDVGYLVATDAIGMGLNLDISHVAFSALSKFDGQKIRQLTASELAQIAGRAGRYTQAGTFGTTGDTELINEHDVKAIGLSLFPKIKKLQWRNNNLSFNSTDDLIASLELNIDNPWLVRCKQMIDLESFKALSQHPSIKNRVSSPEEVKLLWEICQIPDFRDISFEEHLTLLNNIFQFRFEKERVPTKWLQNQVYRIDRIDGDIDTLSQRLAFIRTWTYVSQAKNWVDEEDYWKERTREVEDRLSDALHEALTKRFVDRRTSILLRKLKSKETVVADVSEFGIVTIEGERIGSLDGFRFNQDKSSSSEESKAIRQAALLALQPHVILRSDKLYMASDLEFDISDQGHINWNAIKVGKLIKGSDCLKPLVEVFVDKEMPVEIKTKVTKRLQLFVNKRINTYFEKLITMMNDDSLNGIAKGFAFRLFESLGILPRESVLDEVKNLDQDDRAKLRKHGVRFGQFTVFFPILLKPAATNLRMTLSSLFMGLKEFPVPAPAGLVTIPAISNPVENYYRNIGYRLCGRRAIRIDMLERLADLLRSEDSRKGFEANPDMLSITGTSLDQFANLLEGLGYTAEKGERTKLLDKSINLETNDISTQDQLDLKNISTKTVGSEKPNDDKSDKVIFYVFKWLNTKYSQDKKKNKKKNEQKFKKVIAKSGTDSRRKPNPEYAKKKNKEIDPNNPFAAALMDFKEKN